MNVKLTDAVIVPVMTVHNISRDEAVKRLTLLYEGNLLKHGNPNDPDTQQMIDNFLAQDSETLAEIVLFDKCFTQCIENKDFVKQYDRLTKRNLSGCLLEMEMGNIPNNHKKEFELFEKFVRETVMSRFQTEQ